MSIEEIRERFQNNDGFVPSLASDVRVFDGSPVGATLNAAQEALRRANIDRATLLAEVDRLTNALADLDYQRNQETSRLMALCGRAAEVIESEWGPCDEQPPDDEPLCGLTACELAVKLREAAKG